MKMIKIARSSHILSTLVAKSDYVILHSYTFVLQ